MEGLCTIKISINQPKTLCSLCNKKPCICASKTEEEPSVNAITEENGVNLKNEKGQGPILSEIMVQLQAILAEQTETTNKINELHNNFKTHENILKKCTGKIEKFETQNRELRKENEELKCRLKDLEPKTIEVQTGSEDVILVEQGKSQAQDSYWKEFTGTIPGDALPGGTDYQGGTTYIGKTIDGGRLVPGEIVPKHKKLFYVMNYQDNERSTNIKILCARNPDRYEWIRTSIREINFLNQEHLIAGGYYEDDPYFIGRTVHGDGEVLIGKIYHEKFAYIASGEAHYVESDFEILSYNPKLTAKITVSKQKKSAVGTNVYHINIS